MTKTHVLVVDNSPVIRRILRYVLEAEGCEVQVAEDGLDALDCIARRRPDIIFTDLIMPRIDGEKLCYIVRHSPELKDIFLVVLSGVALEDNDNALQTGADICIAKGQSGIMKTHVLAALEQYRSGRPGDNSIRGLDGLFPREVTHELLVSKKHRDIILAKMTEGVVELNHEGRIVMANGVAVTLFGRPEARILGSPLDQFLPEAAQQRLADWMEMCAASFEYLPLVFGYDDPIHLEDRVITCNLVPVAEDDSFFIIGILQDVSRRKMLEQRQRQLEIELQRIRKMDAMSLMASGIAHDFNNLLTIINGNIEMARYVCHDDNVSQLLNESAKALDLTVQLIRQFTTFSDNYLPRKSEVLLGNLIEDVFQHELKGTDIKYHIESEQGDLAISLDPVQMRQVFVNLVRNAMDAMEGSGQVTVRIDRVDGAAESARSGLPQTTGEVVRVTFHDSGPGIDSRIVDQVFDPYFSTKQKGAQKGMGLGLTIVHAIVKKHGGRVRIESSVEGCTVSLYFPRYPPLMTNADYFSGTGKDAARRVLVMDDDEMMRLINKKMFEYFGCRVSLAANGEEAEALYRDMIEAGQRFDLVLLDLRIRGGMGGLEVARCIEKIDPEAVMIAISGDTDHEVIQDYTAYPFADALAKPFSIDAVEDIIRRFL
ncbi:hybrid sensor histidine kinase/response regulator [Desulfobulbus alkaliphilus]|uniref:hybrid sensor histidine kinase/response regulator n=1 Tax=Desulfobulbus alkaliphilus TaxID=869814 RepID=UPI001966B3E5|nr:hybrid sensor histidine kinase/response regulator [Desulfobulbus alkaliphilus]MBM9536341.1 response regulator [Desulfobulbus alkaliphilus]